MDSRKIYSAKSIAAIASACRSSKVPSDALKPSSRNDSGQRTTTVAPQLRAVACRRTELTTMSQLASESTSAM